MQEIWGRIRLRPVATPTTADILACVETVAYAKLRARRYAVLAHSKARGVTDPSNPSSRPSRGLKATKSSARHHTGLPASTPLVERSANGVLGQLQLYGQYKEGGLGRDRAAHVGIHSDGISDGDVLSKIRYWERRLLKAKASSGLRGVYNIWKLLKQNRNSYLVIHPQADILRERLLALFLENDDRLAALVGHAKELRETKGFIWPDIYVKIIHHCLDQGLYEKAVDWHLRLTPELLPTRDSCGLLLANFAANDLPEMQLALARLYDLQVEHRLYDYVIPALYGAGKSKWARVWRRKFLKCQDLPTNARSRSFLHFLLRYYPATRLTEEEMAIASASPRQDFDPRPATGEAETFKDTYSDSLVAKWLATRWMPLEFALNFVLQLGLRTIGPRSLQSLALRETDSKAVAEQLKKLEERGIGISNHVYNDALVSFAKNDEDDLLFALLSCDVHPNEFDNKETRQMLAATAVRAENKKLIDLFLGIERVVHRTRQSYQSVRPDEHARENEDTSIEISGSRPAFGTRAAEAQAQQSSMTDVLQHYFNDVGWHANQGGDDFVRLDQAINAMRTAARQERAVPAWCWRKALFILGRTGRLDELEHLSLEIVMMYNSNYNGLMPVHQRDVPDFLFHNFTGSAHILTPGNHDVVDVNPEFANAVHDDTTTRPGESYRIDIEIGGTDEIRSIMGATAETCERLEQVYIPADLDFAHRQHPINRIFDPYLQRSIIRWGFDQTMKRRPYFVELDTDHSLGPQSYDVARGVHLLARLRDHGVVVQKGMVRAAVLSRIAVNQIPARQKSPARDSHEMSTESLKCLFDSAWGNELLPGMEELTQDMQTKKLQTGARYPQLSIRAFDNMQKEADDRESELETQGELSDNIYVQY